MLEKNSPINETKNFNNFSMGEKTSIQKINLRGNPNNKDLWYKLIREWCNGINNSNRRDVSSSASDREDDGGHRVM